MLALSLALSLSSEFAQGQALTVMPVHVQMPPGQKAAVLSVTNAGSVETAVQIRAYGWAQPDGNDQLTATDAIAVSPPIATIAPGATQVIRLILRRVPEQQEDTYRILVDQIPPPARQGIVNVVLRLSIPIFVQPKSPAVSHMQFHLERNAQQSLLAVSNDGSVHEALHGLELGTDDGQKVETGFSGSQYILAGATRQWLIMTKQLGQPAGGSLRVTVHSDHGVLQQQVRGSDNP